MTRLVPAPAGRKRIAQGVSPGCVPRYEFKPQTGRQKPSRRSFAPTGLGSIVPTFPSGLRPGLFSIASTEADNTSFMRRWPVLLLPGTMGHGQLHGAS